MSCRSVSLIKENYLVKERKNGLSIISILSIGVCGSLFPLFACAQPPFTIIDNSLYETNFPSGNQDTRIFEGGVGRPAGVWVKGINGTFDDGAISYSTNAVLQVGGTKLFNVKNIFVNSDSGSGGTLTIKGLKSIEGRSQDHVGKDNLNIAVIGSQNNNSLLVSGYAQLDVFRDNVNILIDGLNSANRTAMIIDLSLEIQSFETIDQGDHAIFPLDKAKGREGSIVIQNEGALEVEQFARILLPSTNQVFLIRDNYRDESGLKTGGDFIFSNNYQPSSENLAAEISKNALIKNSNVKINGFFTLRGSLYDGWREFSEVPELTPKVSFLQVVNDVDGTSRKGTFSAQGVFIYSVNDNRTAFHLGHGANVLTDEVYIYAVHQNSRADLLLGDPTSHEAEYGLTRLDSSGGPLVVKMNEEGLRGESRILFNNAHSGVESQKATFIISGLGQVIAQSGRTALTQDSNYTGITQIDANASLILTNPHATGYSDVINKGELIIGDEKESSPTEYIIRKSENDVFGGGNLINNGVIRFGQSGKIQGEKLTIHGDYVGGSERAPSFIEFDTDPSTQKTDLLEVQGNTSGKTKILFRNSEKWGGHDLEGIKLVHVEGDSADGAFTSDPLESGAYVYRVKKGMRGEETSKHWYLSSYLRPTNDKSVPDREVEPKREIRPVVGAYIGNEALVQTMFISRLHDRVGDLQYNDPFTGEAKVTSMWLRQIGGYTSWNESSGQMHNRTLRAVTQLGADFARWTSDGSNRFNLGWIAGYGHGRTKTSSKVSDLSSTGTVDGLNVGLTGTWYANGADHQGLYVDSWLTYSWFRNKAKTTTGSEKYHSKGLTASLETGYTFKLLDIKMSSGHEGAWFIQPQAQVIWSGIKSDSFSESNGTKVKFRGKDNITTRVGMRTFVNLDKGSLVTHTNGTQLFVEGNWIHNTKPFSVSLDQTSFRQTGARNLGEVKFGLESKFRKNLQVWTNAGVQAGKDKYRDLTAMVGIKYTF